MMLTGLRTPAWMNCDPGAPLADQDSSDRYPDYTHASFAYKLRVQILPNDEEHREGFDNGVDFRIGDPNVHFRAAAAKSYETTEDIGKPDWDLLFGFMLARMSHLRFLSTVYVLLTIVTSLTWIILTLHYSIGLLWQPGGLAGLAFRVLLVSSATWCTSPSVKPVVFIWSTPHGQAPLSLQLFVWSFQGSTLCSLTATVCQSRFSKLKICGKKHSVYSIVGSLVRFQPAVGLGA